MEDLSFPNLCKGNVSLLVRLLYLELDSALLMVCSDSACLEFDSV